MKNQIFAFAVIIYSILMPALSRAAVLLDDNFDSYGSQAAFVAAWPVAGAGTTAGALEGTNWVSPSSGVFYGTTAQRNDRSFTESGNPSALSSISFSFNFYDSNAAASPYRQVSSLIDGAGSSSGQLISLGMNNNQTSANSGGNYYMARILGYTPPTIDPDGGPNESPAPASGIFFKLNDYGVGLRTTGWHNLGVTITPTVFSFYVDGVLAETVANAVTLRSYDSVRLGSGITSANVAWLDDVLVQVNQVPEPATAALAGIGICALIGMRRCRK